MRTGVVIVAAFLCIAISGCGSDSVPGVSQILSLASGEANDMPAEQGISLRLSSGDRLRIAVFGEDRLSGEYSVGDDGYIALPLLGSIQAEGLSKIDLGQSISDKFSGKYLNRPIVTVDVSAYRPFYVLGEVEKSGQYEYRSGLNVVSALAISGGTTYRASKTRVLIQRRAVGPFQEFPLSPLIPVYPGDLINVPERYF